MKPTPKEPIIEMKKTSLKLPQPLWRAAHVLALDSNREFQEIVATALAEYLDKQKGGKK
jgi:hypothetical protein